MAKQFVTGFGQKDTRAQRLSDGRENPSRFAGQNYETITFASVAKLAANPKAKPKAGAQWCIFSDYVAHDARSHDRQRQDGNFYALAIDVDDGNHSMAAIQDALRHTIGDAAVIIYSTSGATEENRKWRALIPLSQPLLGWQYALAQRAFFDLLADQGINCDRALQRPGQPIYLPNVPMDKRNAASIPLFYRHEIIRAASFTYAGSAIEAREEQNLADDCEKERLAIEAAQARKAEREARGFNNDSSVVGAFNERHVVEELLERYGYKREGRSAQYQSRYQSSGSYATKSFGDYWVSLSGSDAGANIGTVKESYCWGDAFDLFCHYEHAGDFTAAVRAYGEEINPSDPTAAQVLKPLMGDWNGPPINGQTDTPPEPNTGRGPIMVGSGVSQIKQQRIFDLESARPQLASSYLIKGWLGKSQMSVVYGPSNVGKSFFCLDMAFAVAASQQWTDSRVRGGTVLYLATEGGNAFRNRVYALRLSKGIDKAPLVVRPSPVDLLRAEVDLPALGELCKEVTEVYGEIQMIVVDTLSRAMAGGNENGPEDMTRFIGNLDVLRDLTGAHIMVVHHTGKDTAAGARGHSSLRAATDTEIELEVTESGLRVAKTTKQRDMEPKPPLGFTLAVHDLGRDEDGDAVTTCTIEIADDEDVKDATNRKPLGAVQKKIIDCFKLLRGESKGGGNPGGPGFPAPNEFWAIEYDEVLDLFRGKSTHERPKKQFDQAITSLERAGEIVLNGGFLWLPNKSGRMR